jgi:tRNA A37 threonylcarbamoyladenosine modification protein TsaB
LGVVTARTLAQQLNLPLFAISTLAAVAWTKFTAAPRSTGAEDMAIQMPAHRGEIYGAIYSVTNENHNARITALLPDSVMSQERWQLLLDDWKRPHQLVAAEASLGATAISLLELAYLDWQLGLRPSWTEALPFYGQSPV